MEYVRRSIHCYLCQSYPNRELVVLCDDEDDGGELNRLANSYSKEGVKYLFVDIAKTNNNLPFSLGELRNLAVKEANGEWITQWDDDDLYSPSRIDAQYELIRAENLDACFLSSWMMYIQELKVFGITNLRVWEGSIMMKKSLREKFIYPDQRREEDLEMVRQMASTEGIRMAVLHRPSLYLYYHHGNNTNTAAHFQTNLSQNLSERYLESVCLNVIEGATQGRKDYWDAVERELCETNQYIKAIDNKDPGYWLLTKRRLTEEEANSFVPVMLYGQILGQRNQMVSVDSVL